MSNDEARDESYQVELRLFSSEPEPTVFRTIHRTWSDKADYPMVVNWCYIVSKRLRMAASQEESGLDDVEKLVAEYLGDKRQEGETDEEFIRSLALAEVIEVGIPYEKEEKGWASRIFPWENALSIATRRFRKKQLVVVRHLDVTGHNGKKSPKVSAKGGAMVIRSTPGLLGKENDFLSDMELVRFSLKGAEGEFLDEDTPTPEEALQAIQEEKPALIHLALLDARGVEMNSPGLLKDAWTDPGQPGEEGVREGIVLEGVKGPYHALTPEETGALVTGNETYRPELVSLATCYSAGRIAPMAVAAGACAAIGFHEDVTDAVTAAFFGAFYKAWSEEDWDLLKAFQEGLKKMWGQPETGRSGVALWSSESLVSNRGKLSFGRGQGRTTRRGAKVMFESTGQATRGPRSRAVQPPPPDRSQEFVAVNGESAGDIFTVICEPLAKVNYCSLHNGRDLFRNLVIKKNVAGHVPGVEARVELSAESETAVWRQSLRFGEAPDTRSLGSMVRVPLGSRALRRVQESTRSNLYVEITCNGHLLLQQSSQVTLVPVDEWRDTDEDRQWLPSFVLPRDPAIRRIIQAADRYLRALCDDSRSGFDGYQRAAQWPEVVDLQVRAIWCALLYDFGLRYINPPPTYTRTENGISQRLRTPTQILEEGRGTCIDLALLLCSCLEYVGIYPVIFLISGHAFPGWWRNEKDYLQNSFEEITDAGAVPASGAEAVTKVAERIASDAKRAKWMVTGEMGFRELVKPLRQNSLAAIESTELCFLGAFDAALESGRKNLADPSIFDAMVDVQRARDDDNPVTPLPMIGSPMAD